MLRENLNDILALRAVVAEGSFTKAAARLGVSQSALSHAIRGLEGRLGIRLLVRTTRSLAPTEAGERFLVNITPHLDQIETELEALNALRDKPAGTIRITTSDHPVEAILLPAIGKLAPHYPDIKFEIIVDNGLNNIVVERYDAGIRLGEQIEKDMIAVRVGPDMRMVVVGSPDYFARHPKPRTPRDLTDHNCINIHLPTLGGLYAWEFEKAGKELNVRVNGQLTFNNGTQVVAAAVTGLGLAMVPEHRALGAITDGKLIRTLGDWCPPFPGYHLYYPSRRQISPAFALFVEAIRYRG